MEGQRRRFDLYDEVRLIETLEEGTKRLLHPAAP